MSEDFIKFCQKVGIVAGAALAVGALITTWGGFVYKRAMDPITAAIAAESAARVDADNGIVDYLTELSRDRMDYLDILASPAGRERETKIRGVRIRWAEADRIRRFGGVKPVGR